MSRQYAHRAARAFRDDRGMGLAEVVVASVILAVVAVGILSMFSIGVQSSLASRERSIVSEVADAYMERIRVMPYSDVGLTTGNPTGTLEAQETTSQGGLDVVLDAAITWVNDPAIQGTEDYKRVQIQVTAYRDGVESQSTARETFVRQDDNLPEDRIPPIIEWGMSAPEDGAIVWGTGVTIDAAASTPMDATKLVRVTYYCDSQPLRDSVGAPADWTLNVREFSQSFQWDTTRVNEDNAPLSPDGTRVVKITVADVLGQQDYKSRQYVVDNYPPAAPTNLVMESPVPSQVRISWAGSYDGTDPAAGYRVELMKEHKADQYWDTVWAGNAGEAETAVTRGEYAPFSRFWSQVWALSPRGLYSPVLTYGTEAFVSAPLLPGTWSLARSGNGRKKTYTTSVSLAAPSSPQFKTDGTVTYDLFRSNDPNNMGTVPWKTATTPTAYTDTNVTAAGAPPQNWVYQYRVTYKAAGWPSYIGNPVRTVWSNKVQTGTGTTVGGPWPMTTP